MIQPRTVGLGLLAGLGGLLLLPLVTLGAQPKPLSSAAEQPRAPSTAQPAASSASTASRTDASAARSAEEPSDSAEPSAAPLPPGHPDISQMDPAAKPGPTLFQGRQSTAQIDDGLPRGSVDVVVLDADETPLPGASLRLIVTRNDDPSQKPEVKRFEVQADERGHYRFQGLEVSSRLSYTPSAIRDQARFSMEDFELPDDAGVRVVLRSYEPTSKPEEAQLDIAVVVGLELEESAIAVENYYHIVVRGRKAWVPHDFTIPLPEGYEAFDSTETPMGAAKEISGKGVEVTGTFPPGANELSFSYRIALAGSSQQSLQAPLPPNASWVRVMATATPTMALNVRGLGPGRPSRGQSGAKLLVAEKRGAPGTAVAGTSLAIALDGLPEPSSARWVALVLGLGASLAGVWIALARRREPLAPEPEDLEQGRETLLAEIARLERSHQAAAMDAAEHSRLRAGLVEALARLVEQDDRRAAKVARPARSHEESEA